MQRIPQDLSPAPSNKLCRAVGKILVAIGNAVARFLGPFAAIAAIFAPALMAVGVTSMWIMYWMIYGKSAPWFVLNLHDALSIRMPGVLRFGAVLLLIAVAATALGLLSARIGNTILGSGDQVLSGRSCQKVGTLIYGAGQVLQTAIYLTALLAIALLGLSLSVSFLAMLFLNATGAELAPLDGIELLLSNQDVAVKRAAFQMLAGVIAFVAAYVAGRLMTGFGKRLNPKLDGQEDDSPRRTLSDHDQTNDPSPASPTDQSNQ